MKGARYFFNFAGLNKIFWLCGLLFLSAPSHATYYGGHHYKHHHYYHSYHRPYYNHHRGRHHGYNVHYGVHARISDTAAYIVLGVLGAALLTHIFSDNNRYKETSPNSQAPYKPVRVITPSPANYKKPVNNKVYYYAEDEGWQQLANGKADTALDIFAIQSQQNLNSGKPKIGFALAAATRGEKQRAVRAMRKAVRIDANALNDIQNKTIKPTVLKLSHEYQSSTNANIEIAFMRAALSYLQQDYKTASLLIAESDKSTSAQNLRALLKSKSIN